MKKKYLIQFAPGENIVIDEKLKSLGKWIKYFENNFIIETIYNSKQIYEYLNINNPSKYVFIIEISVQNYYGRMNPKIWEFIKSK